MFLTGFKEQKKINGLTAKGLEHEEYIMSDVPMREFTDDLAEDYSVRANIDEMNLLYS